MDKELIQAFIQECKDTQEWEARYNANHIQMEDFFKPSGQVEKDTKDYAHLMRDISKIKAIKGPVKSRKEYFRKYWLKNKSKKNKSNEK